MKKRGWKKTMIMSFDILFVLILCFAILLVTMLLNRSAVLEPSNGYHINIFWLAAVVVSLVAYLGYMLKTSIRGLRDLMKKYFEK